MSACHLYIYILPRTRVATALLLLMTARHSIAGIYSLYYSWSICNLSETGTPAFKLAPGLPHNDNVDHIHILILEYGTFSLSGTTMKRAEKAPAL